MELDDITAVIIDASVQIHRALGPGLLETVYEMLLASEIARRGLRAERQHLIGFSYNGVEIEDAFRADLIVEQRVIVEVKSVERLSPVHRKQLLTYLRLTNLRVGLLLNFGAETMKDGLKRVVNDFVPSPSRLRVNHSDRAHSIPERVSRP
jgi:GxxExxY protein